MVEVIVNSVLGKLAKSLIEEPHMLCWVADKAESLTRELQRIHAFLKDADSNEDKRVKRWENDVMEVACMIECALDMYLAEMNVICNKPNTLKKIFQKLIAKHKLRTEIDKIRARTREIKYGISELKASTDGRVSTQQQLVGRLANLEIDEEVVGLKDAIDDIIRKLIDVSISRRSVVSIVGQPGSGKTTLAKKVYRSGNVQSHFDRCIWLSINAEFDVTKILKTILGRVNCIDSNFLGQDDINNEIHFSLKEEKYLIVLDDIWENQSDLLSNAIYNVLPDSNNGSRVLITTRFVNVAKKLDPSNNPYELALLNEQESQELLLKKACPRCDCPDGLIPLAKQFSEKCAGLPLALVVLGSQLSMTSLDYNSWIKVMKTLDWSHGDTRCIDAISTSYQNMPPHLKLCFMYLALYPEDYSFEAKDVTRLWIAEGFITQNQNPYITMEDTADEYLKELAQRCMVQVLKKSCLGYIKRCQLHDLIREFAIQKAEQENIVTVLSGTRGLYSPNNLVRRVAFQFSGAEQIENISSNLHSLMAFGVSVQNCSRFSCLKVLSLEKNSVLCVDRERLVGLTNLRYLASYKRNDIPTTCLEYMKNLQTVIIPRNDVYFNVPETFWDSKMLRHVKFSSHFFPEGPSSSAILKNLLTLENVKPRMEWSSKLPHFPHLRELHIWLPGDFEWEPFTQILGDLKELHSLRVQSLLKNVPAHITPPFANFKCVTRLFLQGVWPENATVDFTMLPPNLVKLTLCESRLHEDPLPQLAKLPHLKVLQLLHDSYCGKRMTCSKGSFRHLQKLKISYSESLEEWNIEDGAMPVINKLVLLSCIELQMVPNFQHLTNLCQLTVIDMSPRFKLKLEGEDKYKVNHIPSIQFRWRGPEGTDLGLAPPDF